MKNDKNDDEVVDIEEYAKNGKPVPETCKSFRIRIDREKYPVQQASITGAELLQLAGKDPTEYRVLYKCSHGQTDEVQLDEHFSLLKPGLERFMTQKRKAKEG